MLIYIQKESCWAFHQDYMLHYLFHQQSKLEKNKFGAFVKDTLSADSKTSFYAPITWCSPKAFFNVKKKTSVITQGKANDLAISSELVFQELFHYQRPERKCRWRVWSHSLSHLFQFPFSTKMILWGKTTKAELLYKLEEHGLVVKLLPKYVASSTIYIRDAMAVLQMMSGDKQASYISATSKCLHGYISSLLQRCGHCCWCIW